MVSSPVSEFRHNPELREVGDRVEVYIESQGGQKGQLVLSHQKARASKSWERVNQACKNKQRKWLMATSCFRPSGWYMIV